jgi:AmmeMemoRadiSam system protein B
MSEETRAPAVSGAFYPGDPDELKKMIAGFLKLAKTAKASGKLRALVVPHAGYIYSGPVAAFGYKAISKLDYEKAIILGPSHYAAFPGVADSGFGFWETPLGLVKTKSKPGGLVRVLPKAHGPEHCIEVQLPFLQAIYGEKIEVWPLLCGDVDPSALARELMKELDDKTILIASSDLSHYNSYEDAMKLDGVANESVPALDIGRFEADGDACGKTAILTLMHIAKNKGWKGKLLDYRNSGDTAGPKDQVVGYGCYAFYEGR